MSLKMFFVRNMVKKMSKGMFDSGEIDVPRLRQILAKAYAKETVCKGVDTTLDIYNGIEVAVSTPESMMSKHIVYYVHGGGLVTGDRLTAGPYASQLALQTGCRVVACSYRLAPEDPFPASVDDSYGVYKYLLEKNPESNISFIGESAGAYLSLVMALKARDEKIKMPSAVVLNSVVADMSGTIKRHNTKRETTVSVEGLASLTKMYAPGMDAMNPLISPVHADYGGLPALRIVYDNDEVLKPDSMEVGKKAKSAGVKVEFAEYKGCFHGFSTTGKATPESAAELKASASFMLNEMNK